MKKLVLTPIVAWLLMIPAVLVARPTDLRCEYLSHPLGIDAVQPELSWVMESSVRGERQAAYQILVASSAAILAHDQGDLWDSGKVGSDQSIHVAYAGKPLASRMHCYWKVRVWNQNDKATDWSEPEFWSMGLLLPEDWKGSWIGLDEPPSKIPVTTNKADQVVAEIASRRLPARWLRKEFTAPRKLQRATVYYSGLGLSELYVNGQKVGDDVLSPGLTDYSQREFYLTRDVTKLIQPGNNAVGVILGNGRFYAPRIKTPTATQSYGFPKLCLQLELEYADGTREQIVSDASWKITTAGPIRANNEYDGEEYDARREMPAWANAGFNDADWSPAQLVAAPGGKLSAQMINPIRVTDTIKPVALTEPQPGVFIFDLERVNTN